MAYEYLRKKGREAYMALISCVTSALEEEDPEYAVLCGYPLLKMAEAELGSYYPADEFYNRALELSREVVRLAEREGVPSWLRRKVEEMKRALREAGWL